MTSPAGRHVLGVVALFLMAALLWPRQGLAQTVRYVDNLGACDGLTPCYPTIMGGVNAAASGDTIEVFPGVYHEAVVIASRGPLVIKAHDEALTPVIAAPPGAENAVTIAASTGVQVERFILEAPQAAGVAVSRGSSATVVQGNLVQALSGLTFRASTSCTASANTVLGGGITLSSGTRCSIEANAVAGGTITVGGGFLGVSQSVLQGNLVRGGGMALSGRSLRGNTVEANLVSGSAGDGILVRVTNRGAGNVITGNTSIDNAGCDIDDQSNHHVQNTWTGNRFATECGAATE